MPEIEKMKLENAKRIPVTLSGGPTAHPTAGYRLWTGSLQAEEPIVALTILKVGNAAFWARSSHKTGTSLDLHIQFSPMSEGRKDVQVAYCIGDACVYGRSVVDSALAHPSPEIKNHVTGELFGVGIVAGTPLIEMKALLMVRSDVKSVRNGVWHARVPHLEALTEPWTTMLTYGRTGESEMA